MEIRIKESTIIRPPEQGSSSKQHLWLSNIDLFLGLGHVPSFYFYKPNASPNFFDVKLLKDTLREVLVQFSPVAGRLERDDKGRIQVNCNGEGVVFIEAETDSSLSEIDEGTPTQQLRPLIPTVDFSRGISSYPLLLVQLTKFICGGVCLGIGLHHILADASAFLQFLKAWTNLANGLPNRIPPSFDRTFLRSRFPPNPTFHHLEYLPYPTMNTISTPSPKPCSLTILKVSPNQVNTLKTLMPNYSRFEIFTAHIWRCTCKARGLDKDQPTKIVLSVNGSSRLDPPPPPGFFGNLIFHTTAMGLSGEIISEPLEHTAERIRKATKRVDNDYIRSAIDYLEDEKNLTTAIEHVKSGSPNLKLISWIQLPFYDADFGWGRPICHRGTFPREGKAHITSSSPGDNGTLTLPICLETHCIVTFENLFYDIFSDESCMEIGRK